MMMVVVLLLMNGPFESNLRPYDSLPLNALAGNSQEQRHRSNNNNSVIEFRKLLIDIRYFLNNNFIYFWPSWVFVAARGLALVAESGDRSLVAVHGLLLVVASLVLEHRLWALQFQWL